jgi:hypothetical protein
VFETSFRGVLNCKTNPSVACDNRRSLFFFSSTSFLFLEIPLLLLSLAGLALRFRPVSTYLIPVQKGLKDRLATTTMTLVARPIPPSPPNSADGHHLPQDSFEHPGLYAPAYNMVKMSGEEINSDNQLHAMVSSPVSLSRFSHFCLPELL